MKTCCKCKQSLPPEMFYKNKARKDNLSDECKECNKEYYKHNYSKNKKKVIARVMNWAKKNPEKTINKIRKWQQNNPEKVEKAIVKYRSNNPDRVKESNRKSKRKRVILGLRAAENAKRRAALLQRILPGTDLKAIEKVYINCPPGMTVDHIVPLQGKTISGLHKVENLQYLTLSENSSKTNKYTN